MRTGALSRGMARPTSTEFVEILSPNRKLVAAQNASGRWVISRVIDKEARRIAWTDPSSGWTSPPVFDRLGKQVLGFTNTVMTIYDAENGTHRSWKIAPNGETLKDASFSPDGTSIAATDGEKGLYLYGPDSRDPRWQRTVDGGPLGKPVFSGTGIFVAIRATLGKQIGTRPLDVDVHDAEAPAWGERVEIPVQSLFWKTRLFEIDGQELSGLKRKVVLWSDFSLTSRIPSPPKSYF